MQKILITGNGFDLHHQLPTSYNDFITVLNRISNLDFDLDSICYSDLFLEENNLYDTEKIHFDLKKIYELKELIHQNVWFNYFKKIYILESWIDFEQQIENTLLIVIEFIERIENELVSNKFNGLMHIDNTVFFKNYSVYNQIMLLNICEKIEGKMLVKFKNNFCHSINGIVQSINKDLIFKNLYDELERFIIIFNNYFVNIVSPFFSVYLNSNKQIQNDRFYITYNQLLNGIDKVYTFNYTPTIEKYYEKKENEYLHGKISTNTTKQNIVLGVSEINNALKQLGQFPFTKYYQKLNKNTNYQFLQNVPKHFPLIIYVWGHSLDQSDSDYIKEIFDRINSIQSNKLILFYHSEYSKSIQLNNLFKVLDKSIIEECMKKGKLIFEKSEVENVYKLMNEMF